MLGDRKVIVAYTGFSLDCAEFPFIDHQVKVAPDILENFFLEEKALILVAQHFNHYLAFNFSGSLAASGILDSHTETAFSCYFKTSYTNYLMSSYVNELARRGETIDVAIAPKISQEMMDKSSYIDAIYPITRRNAHFFGLGSPIKIEKLKEGRYYHYPCFVPGAREYGHFSVDLDAFLEFGPMYGSNLSVNAPIIAEACQAHKESQIISIAGVGEDPVLFRRVLEYLL